MKSFVSFTPALVLLLVQISTAKKGFLFLQKLQRAYPFATQYPTNPGMYYNPGLHYDPRLQYDPRLHYNLLLQNYPYYNREQPSYYVVNSGFTAGSITTGYTNGIGAELNKNICGIQSTNGHGNAGAKDVNFQSCGQNMVHPYYF